MLSLRVVHLVSDFSLRLHSKPPFLLLDVLCSHSFQHCGELLEDRDGLGYDCKLEGVAPAGIPVIVSITLGDLNAYQHSHFLFTAEEWKEL